MTTAIASAGRRATALSLESRLSPRSVASAIQSTSAIRWLASEENLEKKTYKRIDHLTCGGPLINNIIYNWKYYALKTKGDKDIMAIKCARD